MPQRYPRLPIAVFALCLGVAVLPGPSALAESLTIELDWSDQPADFETTASQMQADGDLAVPLVFVDGTPVAMLGDRIDLPVGTAPVKIDIGSKVLRERPLYSFTWLPGNTDKTIEVETPVLGTLPVIAGYETKPAAILLNDVDKQQASIETSSDDGFIVRLKAAPYAALVTATQAANVIGQTQDQWVALYRYQSKTGAIQKPLEAGELKADDWSSDGHQTYATVDQGWWNYQKTFFNDLKAPDKDPLEIETQPSGASVYLSGRLQKDTTPTKTTVYIMQALWPEITLRRGKDYCEVKAEEITPPAMTGAPAHFSCKLRH